jgi:hypothetical protein
MPKYNITYVDYTGEDDWYKSTNNKWVKSTKELLDFLIKLEEKLYDEDEFNETEIRIYYED